MIIIYYTPYSFTEYARNVFMMAGGGARRFKLITRRKSYETAPDGGSDGVIGFHRDNTRAYSNYIVVFVDYKSYKSHRTFGKHRRWSCEKRGSRTIMKIINYRCVAVACVSLEVQTRNKKFRISKPSHCAYTTRFHQKCMVSLVFTFFDK